MAEAHIDLGLLADDVELDRRDAVLLEVEPVGIWRDVAEQAEIEFRDQVAAPVANLPAAHRDRGLVHPLGDAVGRHHFLRRRVEGASAQVMRQPGLRFAQDDRHALLAERQRGHQAGRAGAGDDDGEGHAIISQPSCPRLSRAYTSFWRIVQDVDGRDKPGHDDG
jgi:hypothetical protein